MKLSLKTHLGFSELKSRNSLAKQGKDLDNTLATSKVFRGTHLSGKISFPDKSSK
jgi:hypothetical protein